MLQVLDKAALQGSSFHRPSEKYPIIVVQRYGVILL